MMLSFPFLVMLRFQLDKGNGKCRSIVFSRPLYFGRIVFTGPIGAKRCSRDSAASHHKLLIDPIFLVNMITAMMNWIMNAFNEATLEPSFREVSQKTHVIIHQTFFVDCRRYMSSSFLLLFNTVGSNRHSNRNHLCHSTRKRCRRISNLRPLQPLWGTLSFNNSHCGFTNTSLKIYFFHGLSNDA